MFQPFDKHQHLKGISTPLFVLTPRFHTTTFSFDPIQLEPWFDASVVADHLCILSVFNHPNTLSCHFHAFLEEL
jgi:hypothetical protein